MKPLKFTLFTVLFTLGLAVPLLTVEAEETIDVQACPGDYYDFIVGVRGEGTRFMTIRAAFTAGYCQFSDVMKLDDELDTLRENFRTAAFSCADTSAYKKEYQRILMEQYFVLNVRKVRSDVIDEQEAEQYDELNDAILDQLKTDMQELFVTKEKRVSKSVFNDYYASWVVKYEDRLEKYSQCDEGGFAELTSTWEDFVKTIKELSIDIEKPEPLSFKDNIQVDNDLDEAGDQLRDTGRSMINTWEYYKNLINLEKSEDVSPATIGDLSDSDEVFTFGTALEVLSQENTRSKIEAESAERMAKYRLLYGEGGAVAATDMQGILEYLNQITAETNTKDFPSILTGVSKVYDRQCN